MPNAVGLHSGCFQLGCIYACGMRWFSVNMSCSYISILSFSMPCCVYETSNHRCGRAVKAPRGSSRVKRLPGKPWPRRHPPLLVIIWETSLLQLLSPVARLRDTSHHLLIPRHRLPHFISASCFTVHYCAAPENRPQVNERRCDNESRVVSERRTTSHFAGYEVSLESRSHGYIRS
jgi:hypothetical protein